MLSARSSSSRVDRTRSAAHQPGEVVGPRQLAQRAAELVGRDPELAGAQVQPGAVHLQRRHHFGPAAGDGVADAPLATVLGQPRHLEVDAQIVSETDLAQEAGLPSEQNGPHPVLRHPGDPHAVLLEVADPRERPPIVVDGGEHMPARSSYKRDLAGRQGGGGVQSRARRGEKEHLAARLEGQQ